jgi:hypothetical protein
MEDRTIDDMIGTNLYDTDAADKSRAGQGKVGQGRGNYVFWDRTGIHTRQE